MLVPEVARIKSVAPQAFKPQVDDMEKRINILFDHLNNEELLKSDTVDQMVEISRVIAGKEWERAQALFMEMQSAKLDTEGTLWMVSWNCPV
jgi:protein transport protein SEC31